MDIIYQFAVIYGACALDDKEEQAIEHILLAYQEVLKENEELRQQNISYKNNIHELKKVRNK